MHPKVEEAYKKAGFPIPTTGQEVGELSFKRLEKRRPRDIEVETEINSVYRIAPFRNKKQDFIVYSRKRTIPDLEGNPRGFTDLVGKYELPIILNRNDQNAEPVQMQISRHETKYEIPFSKQEMAKILDSGDTSNTNFILQIGDRKNGAQKFMGFTEEDFRTKSFEELHNMALNWDEVVSKRFAEEREKKGKEQKEEEEGEESEEVEQLQARGIMSEEENERRRQQVKEGVAKRRREMGEDKTTTKAGQEGTEQQKSVGPKKESGPIETQKINEDVNFVIRKEDMEEEEGVIVEEEEESQQQRQYQQPTTEPAPPLRGVRDELESEKSSTTKKKQR